MKKNPEQKLSRIVGILQSGGIGILPTDTIYGIVASALNKKTVIRIYRLRRRNLKKPMIILISDMADLALFGLKPTEKIKRTLKEFWPGKVSVVLPIANRKELMAKFNYLHRGQGTLAFRLPKPRWLRNLIKETGPLVAPSANFEGELPAKTIREARRYFRSNVQFYLDGGRLASKPSTIIKIAAGNVIVIRP